MTAHKAMRLGLAGDTMLGRGVAERLRRAPAHKLFSADVVSFARSADLLVVNLECCISERGTPWAAPGKPFFFRSPPSAVDALAHLGVDAVSLANNHALDYGYEALTDTLHYLRDASIVCAGAGADLASARAPSTVGDAFTLIAMSDHPEDFAAGDDRPGIAYANLRAGVPEWLLRRVAEAESPVLVMPHWGPNMNAAPLPYMRRAAALLCQAGAGVIAGHSAHVFHGVDLRDRCVLYDLGDFVDDYATDAELRNDLGLFFVLEIENGSLTRLEALPLKLDYCFTEVATGADAAWIRRRLARACCEFKTRVREEDGLLVAEPNRNS